MSITRPLAISGEISNTKVVAIFSTESAARTAADSLVTVAGLKPAQIQRVGPDEPYPARRLEPESHGIFRTLVRAHVVLGLVGAMGGALLFGILDALGVAMIAQSAMLAFWVLVAFGTVAGLMLGGLVTLRPDHDSLLGAVRDSQRDGHHAVVVHAFSVQQCIDADAALRARGGQTVSTL